MIKLTKNIYKGIMVVLILIILGISVNLFSNKNNIVAYQPSGQAPIVNEPSNELPTETQAPNIASNNQPSSSNQGSGTSPGLKPLASATSISDCQDLITDNEVYELSGNLEGNQSNSICLNVSADNVTIDCGPYSIKGNESGTTYGIYNDGYDNFTVFNCNISNYSNGIRIDNLAEFNNITNNTIYNISEYGLNIIANDIIMFENNITSDDSSIRLNGGDKINISNNVLIGSIYSSGDDNVSIYGNVIKDSYKGIYTTEDNQVYWDVRNNIIYNNSYYGIELSDCQNFTLNNNTVYNNSLSDIKLASTYNSNITFTNTIIGYGSIAVNVSFKGRQYKIKQAEVSQRFSDPIGYSNVSVWLNASNSTTIGSPWLMLNVSYNETLVNDLGMNEADLILFKNNTSGWFNASEFTNGVLDTDYGVDTTNDYVWANITDFGSIFAPLGPLADTSLPTYTNDQSQLISTYSPSDYSNFSITWDDASFANAYLEANFSNTLENLTMSGSYPGFYYNTTPLAAGDYQFRFVANDTTGNENATDIVYFTIANASNEVHLYLNDTLDSDRIYTYPEAINATATAMTGEVFLYRNDSSLPGIGILKSEEVQLAVGVYEYHVNATGDANHSDNTSLTFYATVNLVTSNCYLDVSGGTYPTTTTPICTCDNPEIVANLYRNDSLANLENNTGIQLAAGDWNYTCNVSSSENYTSASNISIITINQASNPVILLLNDTASNLAITYGQASNATASAVGPNLYLNDSSAPVNPDIRTLGAGLYIYTANATGDENYSINTTLINYNLTVGQATPFCSLDFDKSSPQTYLTTFAAICSCTAGTTKLYRDGSEVTGENDTQVLLGAGTYNYICNTTGDVNYTTATNSSSFTIDKADNPVNLYLNGTENDNRTYTYPESINATGTSIAGDVSLFRDEANVGIGSGILKSEIILLGNGTYEYKVNAIGDANYSYNTTIIFYALVDKATSNCSLAVTGAGIYPSPTTAVCSCDNPENITHLYRDGSIADSENGSPITLGVGTYNYECNVSESENYTTATNSTLVSITQNSSTFDFMNLTINDTESNQAFTYPSASNATGYNLIPELTFSLYRDDILLGSINPISDVSQFGAGLYVYTYNTSGNTNYSGASKQFNLTIGQATPSCLLTYDKTSPQIYETTIIPSCSCTDNSGIVSLYRNETDVNSSENNVAVTLPVGTWQYTCNTTGNVNYTNATVSDLFAIDKASSSISLYLNNTRGNKQYVKYNYANFTALSNITGLVVNITSNWSAYTPEPTGTTLVYNTTQLSSVGTFNITGYTLGNANYSGSLETWYATVLAGDMSLLSLSSDPANPGAQQEFEIIAPIYNNGSIPMENVRVWFKVNREMTGSINEMAVINPGETKSVVLETDLPAGTYDIDAHVNSTTPDNNSYNDNRYIRLSVSALSEGAGGGGAGIINLPSVPPLVPLITFDMDKINTFNYTLAEGDLILIKIKGSLHNVKTMKVGQDFAILELNSTPQNVTTYIGETKEVDIDNDGKSDISIKVENINNNQAFITFTRIIELAEPNVTIIEETKKPIEYPSLLISVLIIILIALLIFFVGKKSKSINKDHNSKDF